MIVPPIVRKAACDPALSDRAFRVLVLSYPDLDHVEFLPIKAVSIAKLPRKDRTWAVRGLAELVRGGYLDRRSGPRGKTSSPRFRLIPPPSVVVIRLP